MKIVDLSHVMLNLQLKRPTLWEMEAALKKFSVPLLVIVGDEDEPCIDGSVYLKRTALTAGLLVIPRSGHNVPTEEPAMGTRPTSCGAPPPRCIVTVPSTCLNRSG